MKGYFITATDTDAGKTIVTAGLLKTLAQQGYRTLGFKPVASGCQMTEQGLRNEDALALMHASSVKLDYAEVNPYAFEAAIAPHIAADLTGVVINSELIVASIRVWQSKADYVLIEGVGGWQVPLNADQTVADLARQLGYKIILVVAMRLGCINHALLTAQAIEQSGVDLAGWIANAGRQSEDMLHLTENIISLQKRLTAPFLGYLPDLTTNNQEFSVNLEIDSLL
jgi:dethiobiotin synthetase